MLTCFAALWRHSDSTQKKKDPIWNRCCDRFSPISVCEPTCMISLSIIKIVMAHACQSERFASDILSDFIHHVTHGVREIPNQAREFKTLPIDPLMSKKNQMYRCVQE